MSNYPSPAKINISSDRVVKIALSRPRPYYSRGDTVDLAPFETEVVVEFNTPLQDANWVFSSIFFWNSADAEIDVVHLQAVGRVQKSASGFTLRLNAPPPTDNYKMDWAIAERYNP